MGKNMSPFSIFKKYNKKCMKVINYLWIVELQISYLYIFPFLVSKINTFFHGKYLLSCLGNLQTQKE